MAAPFIQLFKTPRSQYVFDVNTNEILPVSTESFSFLRKCMSGEADVSSSDIAEIQELIQAGYLKTESVVQEIRHPYTPHLKDMLNRKLSKMTLQVTQGCNLRCKYCIYSESINRHQRSHSNKHMSWELAKKSVDFLADYSIDSDKVNIGFYGGEPLLEFPLIKRIIDYSRDIFDGKAITFSITTNGTLLTDEIIEFFALENVNLMISLDGPKAIHDKSRVFPDGRGSFDIVMSHINRIETISPEYMNKVAFSMVMDPSNDFDCINEITFSSRDFHNRTFRATLVETDNGLSRDEGPDNYSWKSQYQQFLAYLATIGRYPDFKVSVISKGAIDIIQNDTNRFYLSRPLQKIDVPSGPCIPGLLRLFVNADGLLFPCERVSESSFSTCIGSVNSGFDVKKIDEMLNIARLTQDSCKSCWCFRHCTSCCKLADDGSDKFSSQKKSSHCARIQKSTYEKIRRILLLQETKMFYQKQAT